MKTVKIVLNVQRLPQGVLSKLKEEGSRYVHRCVTDGLYVDHDIPRHDPLLVKVVSESTELITKKREDYVRALQERLDQVSLILENPESSYAQRQVASFEFEVLDEELAEVMDRSDIKFVEEFSVYPGTLYRIVDTGGETETIETAVPGVQGWYQL